VAKCSARRTLIVKKALKGHARAKIPDRRSRSAPKSTRRGAANCVSWPVVFLIDEGRVNSGGYRRGDAWDIERRTRGLSKLLGEFEVEAVAGGFRGRVHSRGRSGCPIGSLTVPGHQPSGSSPAAEGSVAMVRDRTGAATDRTFGRPTGRVFFSFLGNRNAGKILKKFNEHSANS